MEHLPPVGWADVATKEDLRHLESRLEHRFDTVDARFDLLAAQLRAEMHSTLRTNAFLMIGSISAVVSVAIALTSLA